MELKGEELFLHILMELSLILNSKRNEHILSPAEFALTLFLIVSQISQMECLCFVQKS